MHFYLDVLSKTQNNQIDLIYWDRDGRLDANIPQKICNAYRFEAYLEEHIPFKKKLSFFYQYRLFVKKVLRGNKYDLLIILHTTPGLTLIDYLLCFYRKKYVHDFRDISYEYVPLYRFLVGVLCHNAAINYVSSDAFRKFLPNLKNIYTVHNFLEDSLNYKMIRKTLPRHRDVLRVSFWGLIRHINLNKRIIDALGNDPRFELHYYGRIQQAGRDMEQYANDKHYSNIFFHGQYIPEERYKFAKETDIIHNMYQCDYTMGNAMGNKFYDGIIFGIPQLCTDGSFMGKVVDEYKIGFKITPESKDFANLVWDYYQGINWEEFEENCKRALRSVIEEQKRAKNIFNSLIN